MAGLVDGPVIKEDETTRRVDLEGSLDSGEADAVDLNVTVAAYGGEGVIVARAGPDMADIEATIVALIRHAVRRVVQERDSAWTPREQGKEGAWVGAMIHRHVVDEVML